MESITPKTMPLTITFRNMHKSPWLESIIQQRSTRLAKFYDRIVSCRVTVEIPHKRHHQGNFYQIRLAIFVPGKEIIVTREPSQHAAAEDINAVVMDAFDAAKRQLEDYARVQRREVKTHEAAPTAHISQLFPDREYGFIETDDGREIYFHANSVANGDLGKLETGMPVTFIEELGDKGPQAASVIVLR